MKYIFDCDGVLRDLNQGLLDKYGVQYPTTWYYKYQGKNIFDWYYNDLNLLEKAPVTEYIDVIKAYGRKLNANGELLEIWTNQPFNWRSHYSKWIETNMAGVEIKTSFLDGREKYQAIKNSNNILVEDSPLLPIDSQILLIDRPYNQEVHQIRVKSVAELKDLLECAL